MAKKSENVTLTISISPKLDILIRRQALNERLTLGELVEKYRDAYLREREREKLEKNEKKDIEK